MPVAADPVLTGPAPLRPLATSQVGGSTGGERLRAAIGLGLGLVLAACVSTTHRLPAMSGFASPAIARMAAPWGFHMQRTVPKSPMPSVAAPPRHLMTMATAASPGEAGEADTFTVGLGDIADRSQPGPRSGTGQLLGWRSRIDEAIAHCRTTIGGSYVQIATVDAENRPRVRTVVFRGFLEQPERQRFALKLIIDVRSDKVAELRGNPAMELVWWFFKSSEQFRVAGDVELVGPGHNDPQLRAAREEQWVSLTDAAREQFYWLGDGTPGRKTTAAIPLGGRSTAGEILPPPDTFVLALLWPRHVDYLRLSDSFRQLDTLGSDGNWSSKPISP